MRFPTPASTKARTLVSAAMGEFEGTITTLKPHATNAAGEPNPTYRCLFPEAPPAGMVPTCAEAGCWARSPAPAGSLMALLEAIRAIVGGFADGDEGLVGRLLMIDTKAMRFETIRYGWDEANPLNGREAALKSR